MKLTPKQQINLVKRIARRYGKDPSIIPPDWHFEEEPLIKGNFIPLSFDQNLVSLCEEAQNIFWFERKMSWTHEWNTILDIRTLTASQPYLRLANDTRIKFKLKTPHTPLILSYKGYHFICDGHHSVGVHWLNRNWFVEVEQYDVN